MKKFHNKRVRDRIPEIIERQGKTPAFFVLSAEAYKEALNKKLQEEVAEYLQDESVAEICDIVEVLHAILTLKGVTVQEMERFRKEKALANGAFEQRLFLESVE